MSQEVKLRCRNTGKVVCVPLGATLHEVYDICREELQTSASINQQYGPMCARVNNRTQGMNYRFYNSKDVEFMDITSESGMRTYTRTLFLVLAKAVEDLHPGGHLFIETAISGGYYCELHIGGELTAEDATNIERRMKEIIREGHHIHRIQCPIEEAIDLFESRGMVSKAKLLRSQKNLYTYYYRLCNTIDYFYSSLLTDTIQLHLFAVEKYYDGLLLRIPSHKNPMELEPLIPQKKKYDVIQEHHHWQNILGVRTAGEFNEAIQQGYVSELINVSEALQEKKLNRIVDSIISRGSKMVLIAGPSSSGKTTTSKRLAVLLMASGLRPHILSTDDYFVNRVDTPKDADGNYDFECIEAEDTVLFNRQMHQLLHGDEVELPRYDFMKGERVYEGRKLKIGKDDVIIVEGNHALNPIMSSQVAEEQKFRVYVSALTTIALDDHNSIPTQDIRLLRRILRDYKYRGFSALDTIRRFPSVSKGEEKWIFPFQELADATFNSALLYELAVIKDQVTPILEQVSEREPEYAEASRLKKFLRYFHSVPADQVPPASLLREFAGGSSFKY